MNYNKKVDGASERLRQAVQESGLRAHQIIKRSGVPKTTFYSHMNGDAMSEFHIAKYCSVLNISADWLLGLSKRKHEKKE